MKTNRFAYRIEVNLELNVTFFLAANLSALRLSDFRLLFLSDWLCLLSFAHVVVKSPVDFAAECASFVEGSVVGCFLRADLGGLLRGC